MGGFPAGASAVLRRSRLRTRHVAPRRAGPPCLRASVPPTPTPRSFGKLAPLCLVFSHSGVKVGFEANMLDSGNHLRYYKEVQP